MATHWSPKPIARLRNADGNDLDESQIGIYNEEYLVRCEATSGSWADGATLYRAEPLGAWDETVFTFPPGLPEPAEPGMYDSTLLHRPHATVCRCQPTTPWCMRVFDANGWQIPGDRVLHDSRGHRWWVADAPTVPLHDYHQRSLPGKDAPPSPAVPGTRSAAVHLALAEQGESYFTVHGITIRSDGRLPFQEGAASGTFDDGAPIYSEEYADNLYSELVEMRGGDNTLTAALYAAILIACRPVPAVETVVLRYTSWEYFQQVVTDIADRIALRRGERLPRGGDEADVPTTTTAFGWSTLGDIYDMLEDPEVDRLISGYLDWNLIDGEDADPDCDPRDRYETDERSIRWAAELRARPRAL